MGKLSISEVARHLKVSKTTVSRVFNRVPNSGISQSTQKRVLGAIRKMGYEPNLAARALSRSKTYVIGAMIFNANSQFAREFIWSMEVTASESGYYVVLCNTRSQAGREQQEVRMMRQRGVEGLIIEHCGPAEPLVKLSREGYPFVLLDRCPDAPDLDYVTFDDVAGGRMATQALIDAGRRRIAHIAGPVTSLPSGDRLEGYCQALHSAGLAENPRWIVRAHDPDDPQAGCEATEQLLALTDPPDAIFCANDFLALGVYRAAANRGLKVPDDLAVIGYNDEDFCSWTAVPLASVQLDTQRLGQEASRLLLEKIEKGTRNVASRAIEITPEVVRRDSLGTGQ